MKKAGFITLISIFFSISLCTAQVNLAGEIEKQKRADSLERVAVAEKAKKDREAKEKAAAQLELRYRDAVAAAEANFEQGNYEQAKSYYRAALEIKPGNASLIDPKITEIDRLLAEKAKEEEIAERKRQYDEALEAAQTNIARRQYAAAKQNYLTALELQPGNADFINAKIAELEVPAQLNIYYKDTSATLGAWVGGIFTESYDVFLDDAIVGRTKNKWKTNLTVDDLVSKTVWASIKERKAEVAIDFEPGKIYYVRCGISSYEKGTGVYENRKMLDGTYKRVEKTETIYTPTLHLVDISVGKKEFDSIKSK